MMRSPAAGSGLLLVALVLCAASLALAVWSTWQWWQHRVPPPLPPPPAAAVNPEDVAPLAPVLTIDAALQADTRALNQKLVQPLRDYYATRPEGLAFIQVKPADPPHTTVVTIALVSDQDTTRHTFYYDRNPDDKPDPGKFPTWTPSHLDNTLP